MADDLGIPVERLEAIADGLMQLARSFPTAEQIRARHEAFGRTVLTHSG